MAGPVIDQGAVYLRNGKIAAVLNEIQSAAAGLSSRARR